MYETINSRIKRIREIFCNDENIVFANALNANPNTVNNWVREGYSVGFGVASKVANKFSVDVDWIMTGVGKEPQNTKTDSNAKFSGIFITDDLVQVPFVSVRATAGFIESNFDENTISETVTVTGLTKQELEKQKYLVFEVDGNSMEPTLKDGSQILAKIIDPSNWEYCSGKVFVVCYKNSLVAKRIKKNDLMESNNLTLSSDNEKGGETTVKRIDIHGIWEAVRIVNQKIE